MEDRDSVSKAKRRHLRSKKQAFLLFRLINIVSLHSNGKAHLMPIIKN